MIEKNDNNNNNINDNISDLPSKIPKKNFSNSIHSQNINNQRPNETKFSVPGVPASNSAGNLNNVLVNNNNNNSNNQNQNQTNFNQNSSNNATNVKQNIN